MIPLRIHTNHSLLRSAVSVKELVQKAALIGLKSLAITDYNSMAGYVQFCKACQENDIKPIYGVYLDDPEDPSQYICLLAKNKQGYNTICKLITARKLQSDFRLISSLPIKDTSVYSFSASMPVIEEMKSLPDFYIELIDSKYYQKENKILYQYALKQKLQYIVSPAVYYLGPEDSLLFRALNAMRLKTTITDLDGVFSSEDMYLKHSAKVQHRWRNIPEAAENTEIIADACNVDIELGKYKFPSYSQAGSQEHYTQLWQICFEGMAKRNQKITEEVRNRLEYELSVISELNFLDYFLVVYDIIREAKNRGMHLIDRGSAANSLVSYAMGLTDVNPLEHELYFERFLNRGRLSPPDIDIDFSWKERDEIIRYVFKKFGYDKTAMICTTVTFRGRSAFREVAKVYGFSDREISKFSKFIPWTTAEKLPMVHKIYPEAKNLPFDNEPWKSIVTLASKLSGFPRHLSIHPGGIVIAPDKLTHHVALDYAQNKGLGLIITQMDMYSIEDLGLVKIDLLSQRSLGVLKSTLNLLND